VFGKFNIFTSESTKKQEKRGKWLAANQKNHGQNDKKTREKMAVLKPPFDWGSNLEGSSKKDEDTPQHTKATEMVQIYRSRMEVMVDGYLHSASTNIHQTSKRKRNRPSMC
jgi:hypothetical protein